LPIWDKTFGVLKGDIWRKPELPEETYAVRERVALSITRGMGLTGIEPATSEVTGADINFEQRPYHCATLTPVRGVSLGPRAEIPLDKVLPNTFLTDMGTSLTDISRGHPLLRTANVRFNMYLYSEVGAAQKALGL
jgi:hypothetical protein